MPRIATDATMNEKIAQMVKVIVKKFKPEQIILFGSQARGDAGPDSDVDLLVVMDVEGSKNETALDVQQALHGISVPVDIVISQPAEFVWRKDVVGTIEYPASHEGKVLYAHSWTHGEAQFSTFRPGTAKRSVSLLTTVVSPILSAIAAI